jgi:hypothetical protein
MSELLKITCEIQLNPDEKLTLPPGLIESIGKGRWLITIEQIPASTIPQITRNHHAFLNSYAVEDEGLYDNYPTR